MLIIAAEESQMKKYIIELSDDLSNVYEDIAKVNQKSVSDCLSVILERVIRMMIHMAEPDCDAGKP